MTLGDMLSDGMKNCLAKKVAKSEPAKRKPSNITPRVWEVIYDAASKIGRKLTKAEWQVLDDNLGVCKDLFFVITKKQGASGCEITRYDRMFARHIGEVLKGGNALIWVNNGIASVVDWDNWKMMYYVLTATPDTQVYDYEETAVERRARLKKAKTDKQFRDGAEVIRRRKSMIPTSLEEALFQRRSVEYAEEIDRDNVRDMAIAPTVALANKILEMV